MQIVIDFVTGKISDDVFREAWYSDDGIGKWLDGLVDLKSELRPEWASLPYSEFRMAIHKHYGGSVLKFIQASEEFNSKHPYLPKWLDIGWHFHTIAAVVVAAYPDLVPTAYYDNERDFYRTSVGDYIGGSEVEDIIFDVLSKFPASMGKTKRKTEAKKAMKQLFHIEGAKYPRWAQEPEWPMGKSSPMAYVSQKRKGDLVQFHFTDVDTGETKIIEQLY